jgi:lipoate-protein ligase A
MQVVNIAKNRITSIQKETARNIPIGEVEQALIQGFQRALNIKLLEGKLTTYEHELAEKLYKQKYATNDWNFHGKSR